MARKEVKRFEVSHVHVNSVAEAWQVANTYFPGDYEKDDQSSARAGYPVFRSTGDWYLYVCDLCTRLEVNLSNGDTVNIWIDDDEPAADVAAPAEAPSPVQSSETAAAIPADGSETAAACRPGSCSVWDWVRASEGDGERITVQMVSNSTGEIRDYSSARDFLRDWSWFMAAGKESFDDLDKFLRVFQSLEDIGHGAQVSTGLSGFELVFTFYRWPGYDRFMRRVEVA